MQEARLPPLTCFQFVDEDETSTSYELLDFLIQKKELELLINQLYQEALVRQQYLDFNPKV